MRATTMHEAVPGAAGGVAGIVIWVATGITAFWLALVGTCWKAFFEPQMKQLRADREADNRRCEEEIRGLKDRIRELETMLIAYGPMSLRAQLQTIRSAETLAGSDAHEGDDTAGRLAHRIPPKEVKG